MKTSKRYRNPYFQLWLRLATLCIFTLFGTCTRGDNGPAHQVLQSWPISLGTSGSNINSYNEPYCCSGTLGALVQDTAGIQYILGSAILARGGFGQIGDPITQPGTRDYLCVPAPFAPNIVAQLTAYVPLKFATSKKDKAENEVTAAIARVHYDAASGVPAVRPDGYILDIGPVSPVVAAPTVGLKVKKSGRNTGLTFGVIKAINVAVDADAAPIACAGTGPLNSRMVNQIKIGGDGFAVMTADSGSLVVTDGPGSPRPVGIVWAHGPTFALACRVDRALALLSTQLGSTLSFPPIASPSAASDDNIDAPVELASVRHWKIERAQKVQEHHFDALFNIPDVVGHGIGVSDDGEPVIEVYLRNENVSARAKLPAVLEGVATRVLVTGPMIAN